MGQRWIPPKEKLQVVPEGQGWAVKLHFGLKTRSFATMQEAEEYALEFAMKHRPSEVVILGPDDRLRCREQFIELL